MPITLTSLGVRCLTAALCLLAGAAGHAAAQHRPSFDAELFAQWTSVDSRRARGGLWHAAATVSVPVVQRGAFAWVASGQLASVVERGGEDATCLILPGGECRGSMDVMPRGALLTGVAFRDGPLVLRLQGGAARYDREFEGGTSAPQLRLDATFLARSRVGVTVSASRAWLPDYLGASLGMTAVGVGIRVVPHR